MSASNTQIGQVSRRFIYKMLIPLLSLCLWVTPAIAAEGPQAVVKNGTDEVLNLLRQYPEASRARTKQIEAVISRFFDFEAMARLAVGPDWNSVSPQQQREFTGEFKKLLFATYLGDIEKYAGQNISYYTGSLSPNHALVEGSIYNEGNPIYLDYSLHLVDGNWRVYDVAVSGMSLAVSYRNQFDSLLANGSFNDLLTALKRKTEHICSTGRC